MVLSLFLPSIVVLEGTLLVVEEARAVRGELNVELRALSVGNFNGTLVTGFLSTVGIEPARERLTVPTGGLFSESLEAAAGVRDARFAVPATIALFGSADGLVGPFFSSSVELIEALARWLEVVEMAVVVGRRAVEDEAGGRAGGLLKVLPCVKRLDVTELVLEADDGVGAVGRFGAVVVSGRFGGTVDLEANAVFELAEALPFFGLGDAISSTTAVGSSSDRTSASMGASSTAEAMAKRILMFLSKKYLARSYRALGLPVNADAKK